jgi:hypothetical protein
MPSSDAKTLLNGSPKIGSVDVPVDEGRLHGFELAHPVLYLGQVRLRGVDKVDRVRELPVERDEAVEQPSGDSRSVRLIGEPRPSLPQSRESSIPGFRDCARNGAPRSRPYSEVTLRPRANQGGGRSADMHNMRRGVSRLFAVFRLVPAAGSNSTARQRRPCKSNSPPGRSFSEVVRVAS